MERLVITGHGRHGKDTVSEMLRDRYGFTFISSSEFAADRVVFPQFKDRYKNVEECFQSRHEHRQEWYDAITAYNTPDRARLGRELFERYSIYCGIRNRQELDAIIAERLCDCVVWVDASERVPLEPTTSITVGPDQADYVILNNGTLEQLEAEVDVFVRWLDDLVRL